MGSPVGFRFNPTPEELVSHYLKNKRRYPTLTNPTIREVNIYEHHPSELPGLSYIQSDEPVWYFFSTLHNKYAKGDLVERTAKGGSWKKTGKDINVKAKDSNKKIGIKKTLVFYKGRDTKKENKTNWTMYEYHEYPCKNFKGEVVVCRIERKLEKKREPSSAPLDEGKPSDSVACDSGNNVAQDILENESQLPPNHHLSSDKETHAAKDIFSELPPLVPPQWDELGDCNGLYHNSFSTWQSPMYPMPGSPYDLSNSYGSVQDDFSSPETEITFPPDFNPSKAVSGGCVGNDSDAVMETASAWPNDY